MHGMPPVCSFVHFRLFFSLLINQLRRRLRAGVKGRDRPEFGKMGSAAKDRLEVWVLAGWNPAVQKPQLIPHRNLGCFITVGYKVVLLRGILLSASIYGLNLQTLSKINPFNF